MEGLPAAGSFLLNPLPETLNLEPPDHAGEVKVEQARFHGYNGFLPSLPDAVTPSLEAFRQYFPATAPHPSVPIPAARRRKIASSSSSYTLKDVERSLCKPPKGFFTDPYSVCSPRSVLPAVPVNRQSTAPSEAARIRRRKISERTRALERLMPWSAKMDTATMLENAFKYVKFLQAQVSVLKSMPEKSGPFVARFASPSTLGTAGASIFDRIPRHQLLHILVTSPNVQKRLLEGENCIVSVEQLVQMAQWAPFLHEP
ncbi:transcription factor bHLH117 [Nymphaea colorata]|nr:transcription factor bHLH117 [Nymphaea colorata]